MIRRRTVVLYAAVLLAVLLMAILFLSQDDEGLVSWVGLGWVATCISAAGLLATVAFALRAPNRGGPVRRSPVLYGIAVGTGVLAVGSIGMVFVSVSAEWGTPGALGFLTLWLAFAGLNVSFYLAANA